MIAAKGAKAGHSNRAPQAVIDRGGEHAFSLMGSMPLMYALTSVCTTVAGQETVDMRGTTEALRWPLGVPRLDTEPNRALQAVLDELRRQRGAYMFLRVARRCAPCPHIECK